MFLTIHLLERLAENEMVLKEVHEIITEAVRAKRQITRLGSGCSTIFT